jgi:hypothetical protein
MDIKGMKSSLIPQKELVVNKFYWCVQNDYRVLNLLKYTGHGLFEEAHTGQVRVMFEGYVKINKARIPKKYLLASRFYWCKFKSDDCLRLMRYEGESKNLFYSLSHDVFWDSMDVVVVFESYDK